MAVLRALLACFACFGSRSQEDRDEDSVRPTIASFTVLVTALLAQLQDGEGDRAGTYRLLESLLWEHKGSLESGLVNRILAEVSRDVRAAQGAMTDVTTAASNVLLDLAKNHFEFVVSELLAHLRRGGCQEFVLVTMGRLASDYALRCIPFVGATLPALHAALRRAPSGRMLRVACKTLEQWANAVSTYWREWQKCPFPCVAEGWLCRWLQPLLGCAASRWPGCREEEDKQAVLAAVAATMAVVARDARHGQSAWEQLQWLLQRYAELGDSSRLTENICYILETAYELEAVIPANKLQDVHAAVHRQVMAESEREQHSLAALQELCLCIVPQEAAVREELLPTAEAVQLSPTVVLGAGSS